MEEVVMESSIVRGGTLQVLCLHREMYSILHTLVFHSIPSLSFYLFFFLLRSSPLSLTFTFSLVWSHSMPWHLSLFWWKSRNLFESLTLASFPSFFFLNTSCHSNSSIEMSERMRVRKNERNGWKVFRSDGSIVQEYWGGRWIRWMIL